MKQNETIGEYLTRKGLHWKRRGDEAVMNCPICGDKDRKFAVNLISGAFNCFHLNSCGIRGSYSDLRKLLGDTPLPKEIDRFVRKVEKDYRKPNVEIGNLTSSVIQYLNRRGFTEETLQYFKIGAFNNDTVMFPYYRNGEMTNVKYRSISEKKRMWTEKNAEPTLFNRDRVYDNHLVICEGEYDCMALYEYGIDAVSVPMGAGNHQWIDNEWEYLETFEGISIVFDEDSAGQKAAREVVQKLGPWRCRIVHLPLKDVNKCLLQNVSIHRYLDEAETIVPNTLVIPSHFKEEVQEIFSMGSKLFGDPTAWEGLSKLLKGWRGGEVTIWTGRNGSGKSTILNQHVLDMAAKGIKTCIFSGEMPPARYLRWAVVQHTQNDAPAPLSIEKSLRWMDGRLYVLNVIGNVTPEKLLDDFQYAARRYNVQHFIVDSLMKVSLDLRDEYNAQKDFVANLCEFAQRFNVHVHLVSHPRKGMSDDETPGKVDVRGSSHITDLAHNVLVLNRTSEEDKEHAQNNKKSFSDAQIFVKKNREFGIEGRVHLFFDERTKRFSDAN